MNPAPKIINSAPVHRCGIKFGTDGWRGVIAEDFTFDNVRVVAQAVADYLNRQFKGRKRILIGYDTRFLSDKFAEAAAEVLAANGIKVLISDRPVPTPTVSFTIRLLGLTGGIIITASHNPSRFNGFKFKTRFGSPAEPAVTNKIEKNLFKNKVKSIPFEEGLKSKIIAIINPIPKYIEAVRRYLDLDLLKGSNLRVIADAMYGAGNSYYTSILKETSVKMDVIHFQANPTFGGVKPEPLPSNLSELISIMKRADYDIGLVTDGDADRVAAFAPGGRFITPGEIMSLLALHFIENRHWRGAIVKNIAGPMLLEKISAHYNLKLFETPVGFKHIARLMQREVVLVGGEESGGIGIKNYIPERDGILTGLLLVEMMAQKRQGILEIIKDMEKRFGKFRYHREDIEIPLKTRGKIVAKLFSALKGKNASKVFRKKIVRLKTYDGLKFLFEDESWLLIRASGTEPILRVYSEAHSDREAKSLIKRIDNMVSSLTAVRRVMR